MKPIKFITTFSRAGYDVYGKTWLDTFAKNVKDSNITVDLYIDFTIPEQSNVNTIDYNLAIPEHNNWLSRFNQEYSGGPLYNKKMGMRFSYKSFVMQHALKNNLGCYVVWLDGDCIFKQNQDYSTFAGDLLNGKFIAVQREHNGGEDHCESGIVIFDPDHADKDLFLSYFTDNYKIENIKNIHSPYDGFLIYKSLRGIDYVDMNDGYGRGGIQSDPNETFLHPEINKRFLHNIGPTGKHQYEAFKYYATTDEYFKLLNGRTKKTPEEIKQIRQSLLAKRNNRG